MELGELKRLLETNHLMVENTNVDYRFVPNSDTLRVKNQPFPYKLYEENSNFYLKTPMINDDMLIEIEKTNPLVIALINKITNELFVVLIGEQ